MMKPKLMIRVPSKIDPGYRAWIRRQECVGFSDLAGGTPHRGDVVCHHVNGRGMGGGKQDDRDGVPLCNAHHITELHAKGALAPLDAQGTKAYLECCAHYLLKKYLDEEVLCVLGDQDEPF